MKDKLKKLVVLIFGILFYICSVRYGAQLSIIKNMHLFLPDEMQCTGKEAAEILEILYDSNFSNVFISTSEKQILVENPILGNTAETNLIRYKGTLNAIIPECNTLDFKDEKGCFINEKTAVDLFGSDRVEGELIEIEGIEYVVRQVLSSTTDAVFIQIKDEEMVDVKEILASKSDFSQTEDIGHILSFHYGIEGECPNFELLLWLSRCLLLIVPILGFIFLFQNCRKYLAGNKYIKGTVLILLFLISITYVAVQGYIPDGMTIHKISEFELWGNTFRTLGNDLRLLFEMERAVFVINVLGDFYKVLLFELISIVCLGGIIYQSRGKYFVLERKDVYVKNEED